MDNLDFLRKTLSTRNFNYVKMVLENLDFVKDLKIRVTRSASQFIDVNIKSPNQHMKCLKSSIFNLYGPPIKSFMFAKPDFALSYISRNLKYNNQIVNENILVIYERG